MAWSGCRGCPAHTRRQSASNRQLQRAKLGAAGSSVHVVGVQFGGRRSASLDGMPTCCSRSTARPRQQQGGAVVGGPCDACGAGGQLGGGRWRDRLAAGSLLGSCRMSMCETQIHLHSVCWCRAAALGSDAAMHGRQRRRRHRRHGWSGRQVASAGEWGHLLAVHRLAYTVWVADWSSRSPATPPRTHQRSPPTCGAPTCVHHACGA